MKKTLLILSIITLVFAGCKKFDVIEASKVEIIEENIEKGWDYIKINVEYEYPVELESVTLYLSEKEDMSGAEAYECNVEGKKFSVEVEGLKEGVGYYYCYEYDNGYKKEKSEVGGLMIVTTKEVTNIKTHSAICGGNVAFDGNATVTARGVCWSTSPNPTIDDNKTTDGRGTGSYTSNLSNLTPNTTYYVRAYATNNKGTSYGEQKSFTTLDKYNGHEYVDLGLPSGLLWATCNVGAETPEEYGNYYAWGEKTTKDTYTENNSITYYIQISDIAGNPQYDVATAVWGSAWRMPTREEQRELLNNCNWTWTTQNGVNGYKVTSKVNSNYIFLPAAGYRYGSSLDYAGSSGYYWSSTPYAAYDNNFAYYLGFDYSGESVNWGRFRSYGFTVRPITE